MSSEKTEPDKHKRQSAGASQKTIKLTINILIKKNTLEFKLNLVIFYNF